MAIRFYYQNTIVRVFNKCKMINEDKFEEQRTYIGQCLMLAQKQQGGALYQVGSTHQMIVY